MQLKAQRRMNQQLPVCLPSYRWCEYTKLQHVSISCGSENEWCQWREISQKWQQGHTWKVLPSQHVWRPSPCLLLIAFQDTHEIKMTLITHYFDSSCRNRAMKISYQDSMCTYPRIFLMSLLCSINCDRLQVHADISFLWKRVWTVQAALRNPLGVSICSFERFQNIWFFNLMLTQKKKIYFSLLLLQKLKYLWRDVECLCIVLGFFRTIVWSC